MILPLYHNLMRASSPLLRGLLYVRRRQGKEDPHRLYERMGQASLPRPDGKLVWIHAASVGEAQSALIIIDKLLIAYPALNILITTGTVTSAALMAKRLPERAMHQYVPLDNPVWINRFLNHWKPNAALWIESELWPNMLSTLKKRGVPVALINARLSEKSYENWRGVPETIRTLLQSFSLILTQTKDARTKYLALGANEVAYTDNIKYSAAPLPYHQASLDALQKAVGDRPCWVYASTHKGEEELAARIHVRLKNEIPGLLTILVPRHPHRAEEIILNIAFSKLNVTRRTEAHMPPKADTDIYIADTLGELGLFYSFSPVAVIGRSFSDDGGGGHNPIEAAQLDCAVLTGPNVQYQTVLFDEMKQDNAALQCLNEAELEAALRKLLTDAPYLLEKQRAAKAYADKKEAVIDAVMDRLRPLLDPPLSSQ